MKLTEAQRQIIEHRGSSLVVSASAGSGKTEVLSRRCVALISDAADPCPVDRLLVVTFTRAAAAELRSRVAGMLRTALDETRDAGLRRHLLRQSVLLDAAEIGTIDSWCNRIVRENYAYSGVDPAFAVLSPEDDLLLRREALDELMEWVYSANDLYARTAREWIGRNTRPSAAFLRDAIDSLHSFRDHLVDDERWYPEQLAAYSRPAENLAQDTIRQLSDATARECAFQDSQLSAVIPAADPRICVVLSDYQAALHEWRRALADPARLASVASQIDAFGFPRRPSGLPDDDVRRWEDVRDRWLKKRLQASWGAEAIRPVLDHAPRAAELAALILRLEGRLHAAIAGEKRRRSAYGFGDVQRLALRALRDENGAPSPIAQRLREHYRHVLVDEVQDTSPVQLELLRMVSHDAPGRSNAFLVGDVKQSIYGFREAEPQLFAQIIASIRDGRRDGSAIALTDNFRSHDRLVRAVNGIFAGLFDSALGGVPLDGDAQLQAKRADIDNPALDDEPRIELHVLPARRPFDAEADDSDQSRDDAILIERIEREASIAATRIHDLLRTGAIPEVQADESLHLRPVRLSDVVVLLRSARGNAPLAAAALRAAGVPAIAIGRESMIDSREVADVRNVLALIGNRRQDIALAAYLRGPLVGLTPAELVEIRNVDHGVAFHEAVLLSARHANGLGSKLKHALDRIEHLADLSRHTEIPDLVRIIIQEGDLRHFARALAGGEHRLAMLQALEDFADAFAASGASGVSEFGEQLDALEAEELSPSGATSAADDVVRVMTIHASKGLEFPIVVMLNCGAQFSRQPRDDSLKADERLGIGLSFYDYPARAGVATAAYPILRRRQAERDLDEELRLLYVAATRAREKLIFVGHGEVERWNSWQKRGAFTVAPPPLIERLTAASTLDWLMMGIASSDPHGRLTRVHLHGMTGAPVGPLLPGVAAADPAGPNALSTADAEWVARSLQFIRARIDDTGSRRPAVLSVSALKDEAGQAERPVRWIDVETELALPTLASPLKHDARDRGTAMHRYFQFADHSAGRDLSTVRAELDRLLRHGQIAQDAAALVDAEQLAWFAATPIGRECAAAGTRCRREVPFVYAMPTIGGAEPMLIRGVIDCILERDDGLALIDYKTDRPAEPGDLAARVARYEMQLRCYALAAASIFQRPVRAAHLVFLAEHRIIDVSVTPADLDRLLSQLDLALRNMA